MTDASHATASPLLTIGARISTPVRSLHVIDARPANRASAASPTQRF